MLQSHINLLQPSSNIISKIYNNSKKIYGESILSLKKKNDINLPLIN